MRYNIVNYRLGFQHDKQRDSDTIRRKRSYLKYEFQYETPDVERQDNTSQYGVTANTCPNIHT